jgi:hypothetical protein
MDPDANLIEQEQLLDARADWIAMLTPNQDDHAASRLRELRAALRGWLRAGGFEPDWTKAPTAARYFGH